MSATTTPLPDAPPGQHADEPASRLNRPVFTVSAAFTIAVTLWCTLAPEHAYATLGDMVAWVATWFGWYYVTIATGVLVFVLFLAFSRYGSVRLGPEHSRPQFSTGAWSAMLFAAGIGTDLMFYAVYEPVTQYLTPPSTEPETVDAAREATAWTLFHYGLSGWGMYALMGIALAYFAYRLHQPLAVRSALYPLIGRRVDGPIGHTVDIATVLGTIFGVATSLGIGVVGLNVGLDLVFGLPQGLPVQAALIVVAVLIASVSVVSGVERGIKRLSQANVLLAVALVVFVLVTGRTSYLVNAVVLNVGDFVRLFPEMSMQTFAYEETGDWMSFWTLFFWAWWAAWAAFVGLFLARISRGRTIRQFVTGTLIIPFTYVVMWVSVFGNAALDEVRSGNADFTRITSEAVDPSVGLWALLQEYPAFTFTAGLAIVVGLLFYVTSADSGALVMANLSSYQRTVHDDARPWLRVFWAVATGALTLAVLAAGDIVALQYATVVIGLPFAFVMLAVAWGLFRALRTEVHLADSRGSVLPGALSGRSSDSSEARPAVPWQARMRRMMSFPPRARAEQFCVEVVTPTLEEVAVELAEQGVAATVHVEDAAGVLAVELRAEVGGALSFCYRVEHRSAPVPAYGGAPLRDSDVYSRLEVHLHHGGEGYDVMGYTRTQLLDDVLDQYERHLEFLRRRDGAGA